jgi:hypothetical protein
MMKKDFPRPCEVTSNQFHTEGMCLALTEDGIALVENERGKVSRYDLTTIFSIEFTDRG